ncbi:MULTISPECIES: hypothetical protein [Sphingobacterium]|uniref:hypothetical protein n=1 Tax=Sphingobacterium TaxID=28453 RepID=UPI001042FAFC|nr:MULTISPECIES: hypothetical protein [Sphingobacterium]MCW2260133.1 putative coiled-coil protein SlyX [Sphingobacterium kitahiroshimense]TCR11076.1 hypothetical protein EDF67_104169 [Sphingobacterium sp. JUb78]
MKIGKINKSLIIVALLLAIKPSSAFAQQSDIDSQTLLMSDMTLQYVVIGLGVTVLFLLVAMIIQSNNQKGAISELENRIKFLDKQSLNQSQTSRPQVSSTLSRSNESDIDTLKKQIQELVRKIEELNKKVDANDVKSNQVVPVDGSVSTESSSTVETIESVIHQDVETPSEPIILSVPQQQEYVGNCMTGGAFQDLQSVSKKDRRTPYIISMRDNEYYFRLDESNLDAITNSLQHRDSYIDGFCESLNNYFPGAKSFVQESKVGRLQKVENRLQVIEKINIKYI